MSGYQEEKERVAGWRLYEGVGTRRRCILPTFPPLPRRYTFFGHYYQCEGALLFEDMGKSFCRRGWSKMNKREELEEEQEGAADDDDDYDDGGGDGGNAGSAAGRKSNHSVDVSSREEGGGGKTITFWLFLFETVSIGTKANDREGEMSVKQTEEEGPTEDTAAAAVQETNRR